MAPQTMMIPQVDDSLVVDLDFCSRQLFYCFETTALWKSQT